MKQKNYGYGRVSSIDQNEDRQLLAFKKLNIGCRRYIQKNFQIQEVFICLQIHLIWLA